MGHLKLLALFMVYLLLLKQVGPSPLPQQSSVQRIRRMTPFWRSLSLRPIGASCRDDSECITRLCRKKHCSLNGTQE
ncbi:liver-expressed antimicrobial peptide 2 [Phascolarctos cinereus]|uniref:Liver-expressed antimicrobial peptide 2 n=1 Tax=Phascolarctos cinereus TaxID=38626 RepID=A0A6P5KMF2_PHACI|nr:liver-expressed antimicrobial peptide 2 isoform X2 [Phascolarctos cinereus]